MEACERMDLLFLEIRSRATSFRSCSFSREGRASNFEAHSLARHVLSYGVGRQLWLLAPYSDHVPVNIISE
jgi:hypothetical protein